MEKNTPTIKTIDVDGKLAYIFVPDLNEGVELAVITKDVLEYLVKLLPKASVSDIISDFSTKTHNVKTIEQWVDLLRAELNFHESVNLLKYHFENKPEPAETRVKERVH